MMCYKVPKFIEIEGKMSVFELGNEKLKIHSLSAIFFALISRQKNMKPEKASLHAPKVRFMVRSAASYADGRAS